MKRNPLVTAIRLAITGALAGSLVACGGGGSGSSASDTTSSGASVGAVTGFGSVYVNGTRFETNGSVDSDDGVEREEQLEKGMILRVEGDWDDRGEGRADLVSYDDTLRGPVSAMSWDDVARTGTLTMLGQSLELDGRTVFRGATPTEIAGNPQGYRVRVSAWRLEDGSFRASYVGARAIGLEFDDSNEVEIEGVVANLDKSAETFTINGFQIDYTSAEGDDDFSLDNLANGLVVEVEGLLSGGIIIAEEIDDEDDWFDDDDDVEISGTVYNYDAGNRRFSLNGVSVQIDGGTEFDDIRESNLADGLFVKVEGDFRNGVLVADEIEGRDSDAELDGRIESIDLSNESLVVSGVLVQLTANTLIEDDDDDDDDRQSRVQDMESLRVGDYLEIEGRQRSTGEGYLEAYSIEREDDDDDDDYELDARLNAVGESSITLMNLEILLNGYSLSGAQVGDEVEVEYRQTAGGQYALTDNVEVDDDDDD
ncbi:DUF5666 domain-containing protein [Marinobacter sp. TBZ242]|uniref:DUF5666 domain-containing protein n=1 Tax=Marinobacter azerbaijanicus TaxID=3050455 RepID=A0ABT7IB26_9GAMM|nr:DUF5666 domain-containing protein [Marinobacter sp. TBZ242]MDL0431330.1 DUF5666 domain-containing protein [Marinobacter sp. TBZ242]